MSCPVCGHKIDPQKTVMVTVKDGKPVEVAHIECWWTRRRKMRELADEERDLFGFAISTSDRPKNLA